MLCVNAIYIVLYSWFLNVVEMYIKGPIEHTPYQSFTQNILKINVL
jgi:hypothetical protein